MTTLRELKTGYIFFSMGQNSPMEPIIPAKNIYYLLLYAWNRVPQGKINDVSGVPISDFLIYSRRFCSTAFDYLDVEDLIAATSKSMRILSGPVDVFISEIK